MTNELPWPVEHELEGWVLFWAELATSGSTDGLDGLRARVARSVRATRSRETLASEPVVQGLRRLYRRAGTDPTRYRPSSEALLRRLLKGDELPTISPLVDLNNCLSAELAVPCCVMADGTFAGPMVLRSGRDGEAYESLRGPFNLAGKPLIAGPEGPIDTPITGSVRVKVREDTTRAWLVAYLPGESLDADVVARVLDDLLTEAPVARVLRRGRSG